MKNVKIVIRGCILTVNPVLAAELLRDEKEQVRKEWAKNNLSE